MSTDIRPELSKKSKYWIPRHRYFELKHFVMQYPEWEEKIKSIDSMVRACGDANGVINEIPDPVWNAWLSKSKYTRKRNIVLSTAKKTDPVLGDYILKAIINSESYDKIKARLDIPCGREMYYELYRKFFWYLDKSRG